MGRLPLIGNTLLLGTAERRTGSAQIEFGSDKKLGIAGQQSPSPRSRIQACLPGKLAGMAEQRIVLAPLRHLERCILLTAADRTLFAPGRTVSEADRTLSVLGKVVSSAADRTLFAQGRAASAAVDTMLSAPGRTVSVAVDRTLFAPGSTVSAADNRLVQSCKVRTVLPNALGSRAWAADRAALPMEGQTASVEHNRPELPQRQTARPADILDRFDLRRTWPSDAPGLPCRGIVGHSHLSRHRIRQAGTDL